MTITEVSTKKELEEAKRNKPDKIIVTGELANKLKKSKKILKIGAVGLTVLSASGALVIGGIAAAPATMGISASAMFFTAPAAVAVGAISGVDIAAIITASSIGIALIIAIFKGYNEIEFSPGKLVLRKKGIKEN
jgi:hypothetical protein